jgi:hypothetical protein
VITAAGNNVAILGHWDSSYTTALCRGRSGGTGDNGSIAVTTLLDTAAFVVKKVAAD